MLAKIRKGQNFYNCLHYALQKTQATVLGGNTIGEDASCLALEFQDVAALGDRTQKPVYHVSLALPPPERLGDEQWRSLSQRYLEKMGFSNHQYLVVRHADTEHDHVHIIANRVGFDGKCVADGWDYRRTQQILSELEDEYHLSSHDRDLERRSATTGQIRRIRQERVEYESGKRLTPPSRTVRSQLQQFIDNSTQDRPTLSILFERLQNQQVVMRPRFSVEIDKWQEGESSPALLGVSFEYRGVHFSGSQLGRAYSLPGLQKYRGVDFDLQRDGSALVRVVRGSGKWKEATDVGDSEESGASSSNGIFPKATRTRPAPQSQWTQEIVEIADGDLQCDRGDRADNDRNTFIRHDRGSDDRPEPDERSILGATRQGVSWQPEDSSQVEESDRAEFLTLEESIQNQHLQTVAPVVAMALHHLKQDRIDGSRYSAYWDEETLILQPSGEAGPVMAARYDRSTRQWVGTVSLPVEEVREFARFQERQQRLLHESQVRQTTVDWD
ncbi:MAG: relaxase/mobilization nuclease domain-containing protein [Cyanobacteriota bacterium]|nr:relaxase/mobilization nuclease domain-containing protein [Cyanobacteriota bacterium]